MPVAYAFRWGIVWSLVVFGACQSDVYKEERRDLGGAWSVMESIEYIMWRNPDIRNVSISDVGGFEITISRNPDVYFNYFEAPHGKRIVRGSIDTNGVVQFDYVDSVYKILNSFAVSLIDIHVLLDLSNRIGCRELEFYSPFQVLLDAKLMLSIRADVPGVGEVYWLRRYGLEDGYADRCQVVDEILKVGGR